MMRCKLLTALCLSAGLALATPAAAKPGDKAWATCVWQTAPASAAAWLTMTPPDWQVPFETPASLLGYRLSALCGTDVVDERKPNRFSSFAKLAGVLKSARPATPGNSDRDDARVELCRSQLADGDRLFTYRYDVVRVEAATRVTTFQQYYDDLDGQAVRLPQDLRIVPKADQKVTTLCQQIGPDGLLAAATTEAAA